MTYLEEAMRAMFQAHLENWNGNSIVGVEVKPFERLDAHEVAYGKALVHAVLSSIREPSEEMLMAAQGKPTAAEAWPAMIDAILREPES